MNRRDAGFSLVETIVALSMIGSTVAALSMFFVADLRSTRVQSDTAVAAQVATDAISRVRSIKGSALAYGRDATTSQLQWNTPAAGAAPYLSAMTPLGDPTAATGRGATAALPTTPVSVTVGSHTYDQHLYLGSCWQADTGGTYDLTYTAGAVPMSRVVIAVTWTDQACAGNACSYLTATLISPDADPVFAVP